MCSPPVPLSSPLASTQGGDMFSLLLRWEKIILAVSSLLTMLAWITPVVAQQSSGPIYVAEVDGTITSVTVGYLQRALTLAETANANALIIRLSNRGSVLQVMRPFAAALARAR